MNVAIFLASCIILFVGIVLFFWLILDQIIIFLKRKRIMKKNAELVAMLDTKKIAKEYRKRLKDGTLRKKRNF